MFAPRDPGARQGFLSYENVREILWDPARATRTLCASFIQILQLFFQRLYYSTFSVEKLRFCSYNCRWQTAGISTNPRTGSSVGTTINDFLFVRGNFTLWVLRFFWNTHMGNYYSASWYMYNVPKKVPEYRCPLCINMGTAVRSSGTRSCPFVFESVFNASRVCKLQNGFPPPNSTEPWNFDSIFVGVSDPVIGTGRSTDGKITFLSWYDNK
jgi:hypothetical protein